MRRALQKKAYYSIPYKDRDGKTTMVEGLSIKEAMALGRRWGNCTNGFRILSDDDERVIVEGVFIDFETNMRTQRTLSVAKKARRAGYNGKPATYAPLSPDRLNMAIQAGGSKAVRNAILASLPAAITEAYFDEAKRVVASKNPIEGVYKQFDKIGVSPETVAAYLKRPHIAAMEHTERVAHLIGIFNAIEDGQTNTASARPCKWKVCRKEVHCYTRAHPRHRNSSLSEE